LGRPAKTTRPVRFGCCIPEDLNNRLSKHLFSEVEDRVPHGAKSTFVESLIRDFFLKLDGEAFEIETLLEQ
jgi:hypothetical protein